MKYFDIKTRLLIQIIIICLFISAFSTSYAYYLGTVKGNENAKSTVIESGSIALNFEDGPEVNASNMIPGQSIKKAFSVKNIGTADTTYDVYFSKLINTFEDENDLVYVIHSEDGCSLNEQTIVPSIQDDAKIISSCNIVSGQTHNYEIEITFLETDDNQIDNMGASFSASIGVNKYESIESIAILEAGPKLNEDFKLLAGDVCDSELQSTFEASKAQTEFFGYETPFVFKENSNVKHIKVVDEAPGLDTNYKIISDEESLIKIKAWFDNDTIKIYSKASKLKFGENASHTFDAFAYLEDLDLSEFDTSNSKYFTSMFDSDYYLTSLNLGDNFDTSNALVMNYMFNFDISLSTLDLKDKFDTSKVVTSAGMFKSMRTLESLDLKDKFNTSRVVYMYEMFGDMNSLTYLNLGDKFDTSNVTEMSYMFNGVNHLDSLDLKDKFDTSNVTSMRSMFASLNNLTEFKIGNKFDTSKVTNMNAFFTWGQKLKVLDLGPKFTMKNVSDARYMLNNMDELETIYVPSTFEKKSSFQSNSMFANDKKLKGGNGTGFSSSYIDGIYARIDGGTSSPGYLTLKEY